jgi:DNA-binding MarR family transcriptional regulator
MVRRETGFVFDPILYTLTSALDHLGPLRIIDLAREVGLERSVASRHTATLERAGLIERRPNPYDKRSVLVHLTEVGLSHLQSVHAAIARAIDRRLEAWPETEAEQLAQGLERFIDGVHTAWLATSANFLDPNPAGEVRT